MTTFKDWWGLEIPQELLDLGFEDRSWHHDAGARMVLPLPNKDGRVLQIFVGDENTRAELGEGQQHGCAWVNADIDENGFDDNYDYGLNFATDDLPSLIWWIRAEMLAAAQELGDVA